MLLFAALLGSICVRSDGASLLPQPPAVSSGSTGVLNTTLTVEVSRITDGPFSFTRRSYEGLPVGPTLRVRRGDRIRIVLNNTLTNESVTAVGKYYASQIAKNKTGDWFHDRDVYSYPNHTNLHLHGLHVSPQRPVRAHTPSHLPISSHACL